MSNTYIIGHQKPDTDAVVATMALAELYHKANFGYENPVPVIVDPINPETTFLFKKFGVKAPQLIKANDIKAGDQVVLVDHNEADQRLTDLDEDVITEIVDHHKVNLDLKNPIYLNFKPWGSTSSIVYYLMKQNDVTPEKTTATLMLCAILSDTVGFKSATTVSQDKELGEELAKIAGISDLDGLAYEIFKAKSDVSKLTDEQIVKNDYKVFDFGKKVFIDQLETVEQEELLKNKKTQLLKAMTKVKAETGAELLFVAITDVLKVNTKLLTVGEEEATVAQKAFGGRVEDHLLDIGPKMSRKKEIAPAIEMAVKGK